MHYLPLLLLCLGAPLYTFAQDCSCLDNLAWLKTTFEENDAGFSYALQTKGEAAYLAHHEQIKARATKVEKISDCTPLLYEWMTFFRSGHIGIVPLNNQNNTAASPSEQEKDIRKRYKDWEKVEFDLEAFKAEVLADNQSGLEGIWQSSIYKIGIKKMGEIFIGFIIEADGVYWQKGQVKLKIDPATNQVTYYMRDHSPRHFEGFGQMGKNILQLGFIKLNRIFPDYPVEPKIQRYIELTSTLEPSLQKLSPEALLLRIPDFSSQHKRAIDSLLEANHQAFLATPHLLLDLRGNTGGSDYSYEKIIPYLYTNPIRVVGLEFRSTKLNNARMQQFLEDPDFPEEEKEWASNSYQELNQHLGEFVNLEGEVVSITTHDEVFNNPQKVSILIDGDCASTTEQFLLAAKQSSKVKLFGTTTFGALDISNMHVVPSPCEEFQVAYCLSRSLRIPDMAIDEKGIQPDYFIDNSIAPYEWIDFVLER